MRSLSCRAPGPRRAIVLLASLQTIATACPGFTADERPATASRAIRFRGQLLSYTTEAGRLVVQDSARGVPRGAIFYVAYRVVPRGTPRPVAFVWNGGPGANALRLHLEGLGPRRLDDSVLVDNESTLLDVADLVFMDPVGTGFSRAERTEDEPRFYSTLGDFEATAAFVSAWRAQHTATRAPVYLVGESFGTWRAAAAAELLGARGEPVAGIVLISGGCPVGPIQPASVRTALRVPGWTATALHHGKVGALAGATPEAVIEEARRWAIVRYAPALERIATLSAGERDTIATGLAGRIGLAREAINESTLTVTPRAFRESLLRDRGVLNTFDMRNVGGTPRLPATPIGRYLREELGYRTSLAYRELESDSATAGRPSVNQRWSYDSAPPDAADLARAMAGEGPPGAQPWVLRAIANNPALRVFVASGQFDSFGGCWANEDLGIRLPKDVRNRFTFRCYACGHMIGSDDQARPQLARDLRAFIGGAPRP